MASRDAGIEVLAKVAHEAYRKAMVTLEPRDWSDLVAPWDEYDDAERQPWRDVALAVTQRITQAMRNEPIYFLLGLTESE